MYCRAQRARRPARWALALALMSPAMVLGSFRAAAGTDPQVVRVEETWELIVGDPDPETSGPQITCAISPLGNLNNRHCLLTLNHKSQPAYAAGGLQLQVWQGDSVVSSKRHPNQSLFATSGETVRWVMKMSLHDGTLVFDVDDGESTTWGDFGTNGYLWESTTANVASLNGYNPAVTVANSGVGYGGNRVQSLTLKKVRYVLSSGQVVDDNTARVVHSQD